MNVLMENNTNNELSTALKNTLPTRGQPTCIPGIAIKLKSTTEPAESNQSILIVLRGLNWSPSSSLVVRI
jgi:hypothetical protein